MSVLSAEQIKHTSCSVCLCAAAVEPWLRLAIHALCCCSACASIGTTTTTHKSETVDHGDPLVVFLTFSFDSSIYTTISLIL